jgi:hypothetical protein
VGREPPEVEGKQQTINHVSEQPCCGQGYACVLHLHVISPWWCAVVLHEELPLRVQALPDLNIYGDIDAAYGR